MFFAQVPFQATSILKRFSALMSLLVLGSCWQSQDESRGVGMERPEIAAALESYLGLNAQPEPLTLRTGRGLSSRNSPCRDVGLHLALSNPVTGPHLRVSNFLGELLPAGKLSYFWCESVGKPPVVGGVYFEEALYRDGSCGQKEALKNIQKLLKIETPGVIQIEGVCHSRITEIGPLSLIVEIGGQEVVHPDLPGAPPFFTLYLKSLEIRRPIKKANPKPAAKKVEKGKASAKPNLQEWERAFAVYSKPAHKLKSLALLLGDPSKIDTQRNQCSVMVPITFKLNLQFNYFKSEIVKKSKSSGNADVRFELVSYELGRREVIAQHRIGFKPKDFIGFDPLVFTTDRTGMLRVEALLDSVPVSKKDFVLQSQEIDRESAQKIVKALEKDTKIELRDEGVICTPALDSRIEGVGGGSVDFPL